MKTFSWLLGLVALAILMWLLKGSKHPLFGEVVVMALLAINLGMLVRINSKHKS